MGRKSKKEVGKKNRQQEEKQDDRDPAVIRAEEIRTSASRETVEAFVVAFILALLFRAFIAEAFVIPTGSMAPTLMGAHKDQTCDRCGYEFQVGASLERRGPITENCVVAGICPNCRHTNPLDLVNDKNDATFSGDRILVSKFAYTLGDPKRWDVIVFKFPGNPKQNYIKRLVGLPNETLTIHHGDVYARPTDSEDENQILRKPADKLLAMRHLVCDTAFQSKALIDAKYPSRWQPWREGSESPPTDSWAIERSEEGLTASVDATQNKNLQYLRYFHRWPDDQQWKLASDGKSLADVDPYSCRLITDFYAYDSYVKVDSDLVYDDPPRLYTKRRRFRVFQSYSKGVFSPEYQSGVGPEQFGGFASYGERGLAHDGIHWVGDLIFEADVETSSNSEELLLQLVESGVEYQCSIDLKTGKASLKINDVEPRPFLGTDGKTTDTPSADTAVKAGTRHRLRFSNCDDSLLLWVDDELVTFDGPTTFDVRQFRTEAENHPYYLKNDPLDGAPVALALRGGKGTVHHLRVDRDKYYIATDTQASLADYDMTRLFQLEQGGMSMAELQAVMAQPERWSTFAGWLARRSVEFELREDQFFPMGDNSPESLDARCWAGSKRIRRLPDRFEQQAYKWSDASYVPRDLLVGKALVVFWPHYWNSPVPFWPNFKRMQLIR